MASSPSSAFASIEPAATSQAIVRSPRPSESPPSDPDRGRREMPTISWPSARKLAASALPISPRMPVIATRILSMASMMSRPVIPAWTRGSGYRPTCLMLGLTADVSDARATARRNCRGGARTLPSCLRVRPRCRDRRSCSAASRWVMSRTLSPRPSRSVALMARTASGAFAAISRATSIARSRT